jgi:hypothetical protein
VFVRAHVEKHPHLSQLPTNFFNVTITYRRDSDCLDEYGGVEKRTLPASDVDRHKYLERVRTNTVRKSKLVLWIVSNCGNLVMTTSSRRDQLVEVVSFRKIELNNFLTEL